ncbi:hypothetical protein ACFZB9_32080 [Kitasatospora sp. NPDC008050]|uniref:hypothetical protein n=1 Tax=Kitasatospora sp. NPDC008050 TaxID=3364021 RepID=UPI0036E70E33
MALTRRWSAALATAALLALGSPAVAAHAGTAPAVRTDLRVLLIDDGSSSLAAVRAELVSEGVPFTTVTLSDPNRPVINAAYLSGTLPDGTIEAKFESVVLPTLGALGAGSAETTALTGYETSYNIPEVDLNTYAQPAIGLNWAQDPGYIGALDGMTASTTTADATGPFNYLKGTFQFENNDPNVVESYGYLATPGSANFTPVLTTPIPGTTTPGVLVGQYNNAGRQQLVFTFAFNQYQEQWRALARGVVDWMTGGVHLGFSRFYFGVQVDNTLLSDNRWSTTLKCTAQSAGCNTVAGSQDNVPIRMTAADVDYAKQWEAANNVTLDLAFDGSGSDNVTPTGGTDPTLTEFAANAASFRFVNATYGQPFLGCTRNVGVVPWVCLNDNTGATQWTSQAAITAAIQANLTWAQAKGLPVNPSELVTDQNSGLALAPQQAQDNPQLAPALTALGVTALASNAGTDPAGHAVGSAYTVPSHQLSVYGNAATAAEEADEYNWLYTATAQGGSGACTGSTTSTCLAAPLDETTGYTSTIVPSLAKQAFARVLSNDPTPNVVSQSALAEERIGYPVFNQVLAGYNALFNANAPLVDLRTADVATQLRNEAAWNAALAAGTVTAYRTGSTVTVTAPAGVQVPVTAPSTAVQVLATGTAPAGTAYAQELSGWLAPAAGQSAVTIQTSTTAPAAEPQLKAATSAGQAIVAHPAVPASVAVPVPFGPQDTTRLQAARSARG